MPFKDKNKNRQYQREWTRKKKLGLPTRNPEPKPKLSDIEHVNKRRENWRKYQERLHKKRDETWGTRCFLCKRKREKLHLHRKDGTRHGYSLTELKKALKNPEEWVRLCGWCHTGVHFCMNRFGWDWEKIANSNH